VGLGAPLLEVCPDCRLDRHIIVIGGSNDRGVRVTAIGDEGAIDVNDADIRIAAAFIKFVRPSRGTEAEFGTGERLFFEHNLGARRLLAIDVNDDGGASWRTIADGTLTKGSTTSSYEWFVDVLPTARACVRIRALDGSGATARSQVFSVVAAPQQGRRPWKRGMSEDRGSRTCNTAVRYGPWSRT
jgi:hypothetical protein